MVLGIVCALLGALVATFRPRASLVMEILVLRHSTIQRMSKGARTAGD